MLQLSDVDKRKLARDARAFGKLVASLETAVAMALAAAGVRYTADAAVGNAADDLK
jgi:hypothetical protein